MAYFVALDGGGTKTQCWVADDEKVLGRASGGTVKLMNVDEATATARLHDLLRAAATEAHVDLRQVTRTCFGLAGSSSDTVRQWAHRVIAELVSGDRILCGDEEIALEAAFHGGPGVLVIAGTGSNLIGRCTDGRRLGVGGWGPVLGDEGSGNWIGLEAIRAGLHAQDRAVDTCLLTEIQRHWGLHSQAELVAFANARPRPDFASLTSVVASCADTGDALAISVLERAGQELAQQVSLVTSKMHHAGCPAEDALRVAFTGSVLAKIPRVHRAMEQALHAASSRIEVAQQPVEPLEGALWRARRG
jgi:glucosamine kinase